MPYRVSSAQSFNPPLPQHVHLFDPLKRPLSRLERTEALHRSFHTAERMIEEIEAAHMMRKGQVKKLDGRDSAWQAMFIASLFGVAA
jgi:hypothetical protein